MEATDADTGFRQVLRTVLRQEIQFLLQRLAETGEETCVLAASVSDNTHYHLGSGLGEGYACSTDDLELVKQKFLTFCKERTEGNGDQGKIKPELTTSPIGSASYDSQDMYPSSDQGEPLGSVCTDTRVAEAPGHSRPVKRSPDGGEVKGQSARKLSKVVVDMTSQDDSSGPDDTWSTSRVTVGSDYLSMLQSPHKSLSRHPATASQGSWNKRKSHAVKKPVRVTPEAVEFDTSAPKLHSADCTLPRLWCEKLHSNCGGNKVSSKDPDSTAGNSATTGSVDTHDEEEEKYISSENSDSPDDGSLPMHETGFGSLTQHKHSFDYKQDDQMNVLNSQELRVETTDHSRKSSFPQYHKSTTLPRRPIKDVLPWTMEQSKSEVSFNEKGGMSSGRRQTSGNSDAMFIKEEVMDDFFDASKYTPQLIPTSYPSWTGAIDDRSLTADKVPLQRKDAFIPLETDPPMLRCKLCDKIVRATSARFHWFTHTGVKPFRCEHCGKQFNNKCNMTTHMVVHTGERPYPCDICGQQFTTNGNMRRHRQFQHKLFSP